MSDNWKLCEPLKNAADVKQLKSYLEDIYTNLAMVDYPYKANFLAPLPAYPINVCILNSNKLIVLFTKDYTRILHFLILDC